MHDHFKTQMKSIFIVAIFLGLLSPLMAGAAPRNWIGPPSGMWNDPMNWMPNDVPDSTGEIAIIDNATLMPQTIVLNISTTIDSLIVENASSTTTLQIVGQTLGVTGMLANSRIDTGGIVEISGGGEYNNQLLTNVQSGGVLRVIDGTLSGIGQCVVFPGSLLSFTTAGPKFVTDSNLSIDGQVNWDNGDITLTNAAFNVNATGMFSLDSVNSMNGVGMSTLDIAGSLDRNNPMNNANLAVPVTVSGTVTVVAGDLTFSGIGDFVDADMDLQSPDSDLFFSGNSMFDNTTLQGMGTYHFVSSIFDFIGADTQIAAGTMAQSDMNAVFQGMFNLNNFGIMTVDDSSFLGSFHLVNHPGAQLSLINVDLNQDTQILNQSGGMVNWAMGNMTLNDNATFVNLGTLDVPAVGDVMGNGAGTAQFDNSGDFNKISPGNVQISVPFVNNDNLNVNNGNLIVMEDMNNVGQITATMPGVFDVANGDFTQSNAGILTGNGVVRFSGGTANVDGTYTTTGMNEFLGSMVTFQLATPVTMNQFLFDGGSFSISQAINIVNNMTWRAGIIQGPGSVTTDPTANLMMDSAGIKELLFDASLITQGPANYSDGTFVIDQGGTLDIQQHFRIEGDLFIQDGQAVPSQIINNGIFEKSLGPGAAVIEVPVSSSGDIRSSSGEFSFVHPVMHNSGKVEVFNASMNFQGGLVINSGEIAGEGAIMGDVTVNAGFVKPGLLGNGIGALNFSNDLTLATSVTTVFQIESGGALGSFDSIAVIGTATLAGTADILFEPSYVPTLSDLFPLLNAGTLGGAFTPINLPPGINGLVPQTSIAANTFQLEIVAGPPPANPQIILARQVPEEVLFADPNTSMLNTTFTGVGDTASSVASPNGQKVIITEFGNDRIKIIDATTNLITFTVPGFISPVEAAFAANNDLPWVLNLPSSSLNPDRGPMPSFVSTVDTSNGMITGTINDPCIDNAYAIAANTITDQYYLLNDMGGLCVFDATGTLQTSTTLPILDGNEMVVTDDGAFLLITGNISNQLLRVQTSNLDVMTIPLPGSPRDMDYDQLTDTLFISGDGDNIYRVTVATMTLNAPYNMVGAGNLTDLTVLPNLDLGIVFDSTNDQAFQFVLSTGASTVTAMGIGNVTDLANNDVVMLDPGMLRLATNAYQVPEGTAQVLIEVQRVNGLSGTLDAMLTSTNGSAIGGEDFAIVNQPVQFAPGEIGPKTFAIDILDDAMFEGDESFFVNLSSSDGVTQILPPMEAEVTIQDDDPQTPSIFSLTTTSQTVTEGSGQVLVEVQRTGGNLGEVTVNLNVTPIDATLGFDYLNPSPIVFAAGDTGPRTISIPILNDDVAELEESIDVALQIVNGAGILGLPATSNISINDDDPVTIVWSDASAVVAEADAGKRTVSVTVQAETDRIADYPIFFNYQVGGTATPGVDHDLNPGAGIIPIGRRSSFFSFQIFQDDLFEEDETVILQLFANGATPGDPSVWTLTILDDERLDPKPSVRIISPPPGSQWAADAPILFKAEVLVNGDASLGWEICSSSGKCVRRTGNDFQESLPPGIYEAICIARNTETGDISEPARTRFEVVDGEPGARIRIVSPKRRKVILPEGMAQTFRAEVSQENGTAASVEWLLDENGPVVGTGLQYSRTFSEAGRFIVIARIAGGSGPFTQDWREVEVAREGQRRPDVEILSPANRTVLAPGEAVLFQGRANDIPAGESVPLTWDFGNGVMAMGNEVPNISFDQPGRYQVRLFGRLNDRRADDEITIFVQDPAMAPGVAIFPISDIQINPYDENIPNSGEIFFRPLIRESRGFRNFEFAWDFGNGQTSNARVPGIVRFEEEGTFQVTLRATSANGLTSPMARRTVIVKKTDNNSFEPNNSIEQASTLLAGQYPNLAVDDNGEDFYKVDIQRQGQTLVARFFQNEPARVEIFNEDRASIRTEILDESGRLQVVGLEPGTYFLKVSAAPGSKRLDINYGLSIDVLNPSLYFASVESSTSTDTELGMVNLSNGSASIEVLGFDAAGNLLETVPLSLEGNGRVNLSLDSIFEDNHRNVKWVEVDSTVELVGYARTMSRDGEELYATNASKKRSSDLFVPHIAENIDQWFTRAAVVNVDENPGEGFVVTPGTEVPLALNQPFVQDSFDFLERFGGTLPENGIWARLSEASSKVNMVGVEIFGTKDGTRQIAGLELLDYQNDNPNFLYVANNLFFTHIASDVDNFYTGIALVNVGTSSQSANIYAYSEDGTRQGPKTVTLGPNQKLVSLADSLLEGIGSSEETAWIQVEADNEIAGFEVFGTRDGKRLAGLEATNALQTSLCYPYIDATGETFHGVSLINPNSANNTMTLKLHDDQGNILATTQLTLAPGEKLVTLMADLFPDAFSGADGQPIPGWMSLEASLPTAGFELFTGKETDQMGAILAQ